MVGYKVFPNDGVHPYSLLSHGIFMHMKFNKVHAAKWFANEAEVEDSENLRLCISGLGLAAGGS